MQGGSHAAWRRGGKLASHTPRDRGTGLGASRSGGQAYTPPPPRLHPPPAPLSPSPQHALTTPAGRRYARTGGPDVRPSQAVSLFVVERGMPGFSLGQRLKDK